MLTRVWMEVVEVVVVEVVKGECEDNQIMRCCVVREWDIYVRVPVRWLPSPPTTTSSLCQAANTAFSLLSVWRRWQLSQQVVMMTPHPHNHNHHHLNTAGQTNTGPDHATLTDLQLQQEGPRQLQCQMRAGPGYQVRSHPDSNTTTARTAAGKITKFLFGQRSEVRFLRIFPPETTLVLVFGLHLIFRIFAPQS